MVGFDPWDAHQLKLNIPKDLKIIGYDGTSFIEKFFPQLTTIRQPIDEIASLIVVAVKKLVVEPWAWLAGPSFLMRTGPSRAFPSG